MGHKLMDQWNKTYKHHNLPKWFGKRIKSFLKKKYPNDYYGWFSVYAIGLNELDKDLDLDHIFDHWGTIGKEKNILIVQPYNNHNEEAKRLALNLGCKLKVPRIHGPWHPATWYYEFHEK